MNNMNVYYLFQNEPETNECIGQSHETVNEKSYFEIELPSEATFQLNPIDWNRLKLLQNGHRIARGEWEDYFVVGMKQSNKYCVFAFKDHYVNHANFRMRNAKMNTDTEASSKKLFSANGYCVFEDCSIKFNLKMNDQLQVHVNYTGKLKHSVNEVHARYFRGKSRQDLKEILKHTTPKQEYTQRIQTSGHLESGNADYVGKSSSVYRRIAAEAKDCYQALLLLRNQLIDKSVNKFNQPKIKGYIQLIQHIPGSIICFNYEQICLFHNAFLKQQNTIENILSINSSKQDYFVNTTINSCNLNFFEIGLRKLNPPQLVPLSCMFTTNSMSKESLIQWFNLIIQGVKSVFPFSEQIINSKYLCITCDNSMPLVEAFLNVFCLESFIKYSNRIFKYSLLELKNFKNSSEFNFDKIHTEFSNFNQELLFESNSNIKIHVCTEQFMDQIKKLVKQNYSFGNNFNFGMYAFSCIVNSENLVELELSLFCFMCILYSKTITSLVEKCFSYLKTRVFFYESILKQTKSKQNESIYFYNFNSIDSYDLESNFDSNLNIGLSFLNNLNQIEETKLNNLNKESLFFGFCEKLFEMCKLECEKCEKEEFGKAKNPRMGHKLLYHFLNQFSATIPIWTKISLNENKLPLNLSLHNKRFEHLKSNLVQQKEGVDLFLRKLEEFDKFVLEENIKIYGFEDLNQKNQIEKVSSLACLIESDNSSKLEVNLNESQQIKLKTKKTKNELIKPKQNSIKKLKILNSNDILEQVGQINSNVTCFNLVCLNENVNIEFNLNNENENEEREIVIERQKHIIANEFGLELTKDDLETLDNSPNSTILEFYLKLLEEKANLKQNNLVYIQNCSFYAQVKYGYLNSSLDNEISQVKGGYNLFEYNLVLVPIQKTEHWALAVCFFLILF